MAHFLSFIPAQEPLDALAILALIVVVLGIVAATQFKRGGTRTPEAPEDESEDGAETPPYDLAESEPADRDR